MIKEIRPRKLLNDFKRKYPDAWKAVDEFRKRKGEEYLNWPDWCYIPLTATYTYIEHKATLEGKNIKDSQYFYLLNDIGVMAALASWRVTQGIYRFDRDIYEEIIKTPILGNIPHEVLYQLPEWCVYIDTPGLKFAGNPLAGFFAHLEYDTSSGHTELRFVFDFEKENIDPDIPNWSNAPIHLGEWTLKEAIRKTAEESYYNIKKNECDTFGIETRVLKSEKFVSESISEFSPLVSLVLYLCSANGEIDHKGQQPTKPKPTKTKRGMRLFPPNKPTVWDVGVRMGEAIRQAKTATTEDKGGTHASPRPHVRRAHWHGYWTGPKSKPKNRKYILKWLSPILVNADTGDLPVVIRRVRGTEKNTNHEKANTTQA